MKTSCDAAGVNHVLRRLLIVWLPSFTSRESPSRPRGLFMC